MTCPPAAVSELSHVNSARLARPGVSNQTLHLPRPHLAPPICVKRGATSSPTPQRLESPIQFMFLTLFGFLVFFVSSFLACFLCFHVGQFFFSPSRTPRRLVCRTLCGFSVRVRGQSCIYSGVQVTEGGVATCARQVETRLNQERESLHGTRDVKITSL